MFDDDPEWDLAIICFVHDKIIEASGAFKDNAFLPVVGVTELPEFVIGIHSVIESAIDNDKQIVTFRVNVLSAFNAMSGSACLLAGT